MPAPSEPRLPNRFDVEWAVEGAPLPVVCKDVLLALCRRMAQGTTWIPRQHCPSLRKLADAAGWSKRHVCRALNYLEYLQVVIRDRPTPHEARVHHVRTYYRIDLDRLAGLGTGGHAEARDALAYGLGTGRRMANDSPAPGLGTGSPEARDGLAQSQISSDQSDQSDPETSFIRRQVSDRLGVVISEEHAARIRAVILARPGAQDQAPMAYIRRAIALDKHLERWLQEPNENKEESA